MDDAARRRWLFPFTTGTFDDVELALLDPADEGDRALLIRAEHPDLAAAIDSGVDEMARVGDGEAMNPRLHLMLHEGVANQLWEGQPPEAWPTVERLLAAGHDRHDILHMLGSVLTEEIWAVEHDGKEVDPDRYAASLAALPESGWDDESEDDDIGDNADAYDEAVVAALDLLAAVGPQEPEQLRRLLDLDAGVARSDPRQAAVDPTRREDLVALLHDFDRRRIPAGGGGFDTARLRQLLGVTEE